MCQPVYRNVPSTKLWTHFRDIDMRNAQCCQHATCDYQPVLEGKCQHPLIGLKWQCFRRTSGTCRVKMSAWTPTVVPDVNFSPRTRYDMQTWYGSSRLQTSLHDPIANRDGKCPWIKFLLDCNRVFGHNQRGADKSLVRPGRKQANVSVRIASTSFGTLPCRGKKMMTARVSMLLKSRASLTCFRACFLPSRAKDLSAPSYARQSKFCRGPCPSL